MHKSALDAKVAAVNNANRYVIEIYPKLREIFKPFVGQRVVKADGYLFAKIDKLLPKFPSGNGLHVYLRHSGYSIAWAVKTYENYTKNGGDYAIYHEATVYVGDMRDGVLLDLYGEPDLFTSYSAAVVEARREAYRKAKAAASDALSALHPFGEYDN